MCSVKSSTILVLVPKSLHSTGARCGIIILPSPINPIAEDDPGNQRTVSYAVFERIKSMVGLSEPD